MLFYWTPKVGYCKTPAVIRQQRNHCQSDNVALFIKAHHDLGRMANLRLVDKRGEELVELKLQVLA
jgi:hypothetical protein